MDMVGLMHGMHMLESLKRQRRREMIPAMLPGEKKVSKGKRKDGKLMWILEVTGPRGGVTRWYAERLEGQAEPNGWELWSETQRDMGGRIYPAGTFDLPRT